MTSVPSPTTANFKRWLNKLLHFLSAHKLTFLTIFLFVKLGSCFFVFFFCRSSSFQFPLFKISIFRTTGKSLYLSLTLKQLLSIIYSFTMIHSTLNERKISSNYETFQLFYNITNMLLYEQSQTLVTLKVIIIQSTPASFLIFILVFNYQSSIFKVTDLHQKPSLHSL